MIKRIISVFVATVYASDSDHAIQELVKEGVTI